MPLQVLYAEPRYATRFSWVYLGESAIAGSVSTVAARAFASLLGPPLPGRWSNLYTPPDLWAAWGSFGLLIITAVCSLILQNKAMIHFGNSEVGGPVRQHYTTPTAGHGLTSPRPLPTEPGDHADVVPPDIAGSFKQASSLGGQQEGPGLEPRVGIRGGGRHGLQTLPPLAG